MPTVPIPTRREVEAFYEQARESLPVNPSGMVAANWLRIGGGLDISGSGLIFRTSTSTSTVTGFANGEQVINEVKLTSSRIGDVIAIVERAVYHTSRAAANLIPGGSAVDESEFQVIGSNFSLIDVSGDAVADNVLASHFYLRNISAGTITLVIDVKVRYILDTAPSESSSA